MAQSLRVHRQSPATFFAEGFSRIAAERMAGLPICRPDISVQVPQFIPFQGQWLGVAVTPWSLLVLLACGDEKTWQSIPTGAVKAVRLPAGEFSFLGMNDPILGEYQACSLMSPLGHRRSGNGPGCCPERLSDYVKRHARAPRRTRNVP